MIKIIIAINLFFALVPNIAQSQEFDSDKFLMMTLKGIPMKDLLAPDVNVDMSWSFFRSKMGIPTNEYVSFIDSNRKHFDYPGAKFIYDDNQGAFDFSSVTVTSSSYTFVYDGLEIKTGNNISSLAIKFSNRYKARKNGKILIGHELGGIWMTISFDPENIIKEIKLQQDLL